MGVCPSRNYFDVSFPAIPTDVLGCWHLLADYLTQHDAMPKQLNLHQKGSETDLVTDAEGVAEEIRTRNLESFWVHTGYTDTSVSYQLLHTYFTCRIEDNAKAPSDWGPFIEALVSRYEAIGGWQPYWLYRTWQDLRTPGAFESGAWGPFPPGYKTWYEAPPYPFMTGQTLIDKSRNPGHTKVVDHHTVFYPTAEMWLGPHFWQYAKCTKDEVLAADFFIEKRDSPLYLYLKCWPQPFTRPDGDQGRMQQRLWKLFFDEECEWPPGSGSICAEPMYGPPELMPQHGR